MKLALSLGYSGGRLDLPMERIKLAERLGYDSVWTAEAYGSDAMTPLAYIAAQYCDVYMFHFWKRLTEGRHLWLRNNGSTLISQGVDSFMVITVTFGAQFLAGAVSAGAMLVLMGSNYLFKLCVALADTLPFYAGVHYLKRYLEFTEEELGKL